MFVTVFVKEDFQILLTGVKKISLKVKKKQNLKEDSDAITAKIKNVTHAAIM